MITLNSCPDKTYFSVEELWFHYDERVVFERDGLIEGTIIYVVDKIDEDVIIEVEDKPIKLTHEQANEVYGEVYIDKKQNGKLKRR